MNIYRISNRFHPKEVKYTFQKGSSISLHFFISDKNKATKELIVSVFRIDSIKESDLKKYFSRFGKINSINMKYAHGSYCIEFEE